MSEANNRPLPIGAALRISDLPHFADWLKEGQRDLELQDPVSPSLLDGDWKSAVSEVKSVLDGYTGRMGIHGPFLGLTIMTEDPKVRELCISRFKQGIELAAELGGTHMVMHSPFAYFGDPFIPFRDRMSYFSDLAAELLNQLLPMAADADITLVIENIYDKNPEGIQAILAACNHPNLMHSVDTGHAQLSHRIGGPSPDGWIQMTGSKLGHLHLQDNDGLADRHWAPGFGAINWFAIMSAINDLEHTPRLILELRDKSTVKSAATYLEEIIPFQVSPW